jgi:hypothetical protein
MPVIHITRKEELKVFRELRKAGPITTLYPGDILIVQEAHLKVLDGAGVHYTKKGQDAIRQSHLEWKKNKNKRDSLS